MANQLWSIDYLTTPTPLITDSLPSLNLLCHSKTDARFMQNIRKAVWSIPYVSVASFFPSLKQNFMAYRSSKVSDCIFEIHQLWQSGFSGVYSNCCYSCSIESEIIKIGQSYYNMNSNNILNFQESRIILNACTKKSENLLKAYIYIYIYIYIYKTIYIHMHIHSWYSSWCYGKRAETRRHGKNY